MMITESIQAIVYGGFINSKKGVCIIKSHGVDKFHTVAFALLVAAAMERANNLYNDI